MATDHHDHSRRKHRRHTDDESEEPSKRHKHHRRHRHHRHRKHNESETKRDADEKTKLSPLPAPTAAVDVVSNGNWRPDYDMEEGEILEEDEALIVREGKKIEASDGESGEFTAAVATSVKNTVCYNYPCFIFINIAIF